MGKMGEWQVRAAYFKTKRDGCGEKNNPWKTVKVSTCCGMRLHRRRTNLWLKGACGRSPVKAYGFYASGDHAGEVEDILFWRSLR